MLKLEVGGGLKGCITLNPARNSNKPMHADDDEGRHEHEEEENPQQRRSRQNKVRVCAALALSMVRNVLRDVETQNPTATDNTQ